jgi:serine/threonine protein kinase
MNARVTGDPEAPRKIRPEINPALEEIILHAMERDPRKRYQTAIDMKRELDDLEKVEITHRDQRLRAPQPWKSRSNTALLVAGGVLLQLLFFLVIYLLVRRHR